MGAGGRPGHSFPGRGFGPAGQGQGIWLPHLGEVPRPQGRRQRALPQAFRFVFFSAAALRVSGRLTALSVERPPGE